MTQFARLTSLLPLHSTARPFQLRKFKWPIDSARHNDLLVVEARAAAAQQPHAARRRRHRAAVPRVRRAGRSQVLRRPRHVRDARHDVPRTGRVQRLDLLQRAFSGHGGRRHVRRCGLRIAPIRAHAKAGSCTYLHRTGLCQTRADCALSSIPGSLGALGCERQVGRRLAAAFDTVA